MAFFLAHILIYNLGMQYLTTEKDSLKMKNKKKRFGALVLAVLALVLTQLACKAVMGGSAPTPDSQVQVVTPTPRIVVITATSSTGGTPGDNPLAQFSDEQIKDGIQKSLDMYAQAYNENDPALLEKVVDQDNKPFKRIVRSRFNDFQKSFQAGSYFFKNTLLSINRREYGYVIAHYQDEGGWQADWPYRFNGNNWVLTEPGVDQIGKPVTTETEHFTFITYPWNEDVNQKIMDLMETARQQVQERLGKAPAEKATVRIVPIYGLDPFGAMQAIAWYSADGEGNGDLIHIYAPNSYAYSYYDPAVGWDGELQQTLTHEYTHMAHRRNFDLTGRLADWMSEGLAEYISQAPNDVQSACFAFKAGDIIPILDESGVLDKQDLMHMTSLQKNTGLAYAYSDALTTFVVEKHGGLDGFWKLAKQIDATGDFKKAVKAAFGVSYESFNKEWESWLKNQCN